MAGSSRQGEHGASRLNHDARVWRRGCEMRMRHTALLPGAASRIVEAVKALSYCCPNPTALERAEHERQFVHLSRDAASHLEHRTARSMAKAFSLSMPSVLSARRRAFVALAAIAAVLALAPAPDWSTSAWAGDGKAADEKKPAGDAAKEATKKVDEIAEASRLIQGPAGQPECVWTGRRIVGLLWRDDLDTAVRHRDLYERFGCPAPHIQAAFRCVVKQGELDPKAPEGLNERVHACWVNPQLEPPQAPAPAIASDGAAQPPAPQ